MCYEKDYLKLLLSILYFIYFGFEMSVFKYYMEYYFINVYIVCLIQSISSITFNLLYTTYNLLQSQTNNLIEDFSKFISYPFKFLIMAILYACNFMSLKLGIFYLTPSHCMVGISLQCNIFFIINNKFEPFNITLLVTIIRFVFEIVSLLIYNEIIILNFCGLNENTEENIIIRQQIDLKILNDNKNEKETKNVDNSLN